MLFFNIRIHVHFSCASSCINVHFMVFYKHEDVLHFTIRLHSNAIKNIVLHSSDVRRLHSDAFSDLLRS